MRVVELRVKQAKVSVGGDVSDRIGAGLLVRASFDEMDVSTGVVGADMEVGLVDDGPATVAINSRNPERVPGSTV